jgi:hypothetical protein
MRNKKKSPLFGQETRKTSLFLGADDKDLLRFFSKNQQKRRKKRSGKTRDIGELKSAPSVLLSLGCRESGKAGNAGWAGNAPAGLTGPPEKRVAKRR